MPGPIVAGIASLIVPGLGQLLNKKYKRGLVLLVGVGFVVFVAMPILMAVGGIFPAMLALLIYFATAAIDSYKVAKGTVSTF